MTIILMVKWAWYDIKDTREAHGWKMAEKILIDFLKDHLLNYF